VSSAVIQETSPARALLPKLGSLLAVAPLSVWTAWHLWENLSAWQGATVWESRVTEPGKFANWIAAPARGINNQPVDFEYVRHAPA